jgi:hypothetical protein
VDNICYNLFSEAADLSDNIPSNIGMIGECLIRKGLEENNGGLIEFIFRHLTGGAE